jgi:hypothetical protein
MDGKDLIGLTDKQLEERIAETELRVKLHAKNHNLIDHLWRLVRATGRLLDDKYAEGDAAVRKELWTAMHRISDEAREYLQSLENNNELTETMSIAITNLPKEMNDDFWGAAIEEAVKECGVPIERTNNMVVDAQFLMENYPEEFSELMAAVASCNVVTTANKFFSKRDN